MITCKEIAGIISSGKDVSIFTRLSIRLHMFLCPSCKDYVKEVNLLETEAAKKLGLTDENVAVADRVEKRVIKKIEGQG